MKVTELFDHGVSARKTQDLMDTPQGPQMVDIYEMYFIDKKTGDQIKIKFDTNTRDAVVRELTGGVVLAGGQLPKI